MPQSNTPVRRRGDAVQTLARVPPGRNAKGRKSPPRPVFKCLGRSGISAAVRRSTLPPGRYLSITSSSRSGSHAEAFGEDLAVAVALGFGGALAWAGGTDLLEDLAELLGRHAQLLGDRLDGPAVILVGLPPGGRP